MPPELAAGEPHVLSEQEMATMYELMLEMQELYEQTGETYVADPDTGRIEPISHPWFRGEELSAPTAVAPKVHALAKLQNIARPRERRAKSGQRARAASGDDDHLPRPDLEVRSYGAVTPQARRDLAQTFLRILRGREPKMFWTLLPDEPQAILDGSAATSAGSSRDENPIENGGE